MESTLAKELWQWADRPGVAWSHGRAPDAERRPRPDPRRGRDRGRGAAPVRALLARRHQRPESRRAAERDPGGDRGRAEQALRLAPEELPHRLDRVGLVGGLVVAVAD